MFDCNAAGGFGRTRAFVADSGVDMFPRASVDWFYGNPSGFCHGYVHVLAGLASVIDTVDVSSAQAVVLKLVNMVCQR